MTLDWIWKTICLDTSDDNLSDREIGKDPVCNENKEHAKQSSKYAKPKCQCLFCNKPQSRLKRHLLTKHKNEEQVKPLLKLNAKDLDREIDLIGKEGIRKFNIDSLHAGKDEFLRERRKMSKSEDIEAKDHPVMCSGCYGFFAVKFKARPQLNCPAAGHNLMVPMVSIDDQLFEDYPEDFKDLLSSLHLGEVGNIVKKDKIILMIGLRSFNSLKRKKDKRVEVRKSVRSRMLGRLYLKFKFCYDKQSKIQLHDLLKNTADMFRNETVFVLNEAINLLCKKPVEETIQESISNQKSGLKLSIFNLLKLSGQMIMGHFTVTSEDERNKKVSQFLQALKWLESELFGDAYYDINYRRNRTLRKPVTLPKDDDVQLLLTECHSITASLDPLLYPVDEYVKVRSAVATFLIIFCARRGGEPVRLQLFQWDEAVNGDWLSREDIPEEFDQESMLLTYQTGKGADHLVPVIFP